MTVPPSRAEVIGNELAIAWADGTESFIALETLRRACPCAACGGEPDVLGRVVRPARHFLPTSFRLGQIRFVGRYALQPVWGDGHDSGLFSYALLRQLGEAPPSSP